MGIRSTTIAIDGGGIAQFIFHSGTMAGIHFGVGPNVPITIVEATARALKAGKCSHNWFQAAIQEANTPRFLSVQVITDGHVSCNFLPDGLEGYHIPANKNVVLNYNHETEDTSVAEMVNFQ